MVAVSRYTESRGGEIPSGTAKTNPGGQGQSPGSLVNEAVL